MKNRMDIFNKESRRIQIQACHNDIKSYEVRMCPSMVLECVSKGYLISH